MEGFYKAVFSLKWIDLSDENKENINGNCSRINLEGRKKLKITKEERLFSRILFIPPEIGTEMYSEYIPTVLKEEIKEKVDALVKRVGNIKETGGTFQYVLKSVKKIECFGCSAGFDNQEEHMGTGGCLRSSYS